MQCSKCGSETAAGTAFCPVCDHPVNLARTAGAPAQINFRLMTGRFFSKAAFWKNLAAAVSGVFFLYRYYPEWQRYFPPCPFHALLHLHCPAVRPRRLIACCMAIWQEFCVTIPSVCRPCFLSFCRCFRINGR